MEKYYTTYGGKSYRFENVHEEHGVLFGFNPTHNKWAWLTSSQIQFEGEEMFEAYEISKAEYYPPKLPYGFSVWGGEIRPKNSRRGL